MSFDYLVPWDSPEGLAACAAFAEKAKAIIAEIDPATAEVKRLDDVFVTTPDGTKWETDPDWYVRRPGGPWLLLGDYYRHGGASLPSHPFVSVEEQTAELKAWAAAHGYRLPDRPAEEPFL
jgi:hypothetical protein